MSDMELQFEHIDWNDIIDAELSGDQSALDQLRNRSVELKRSRNPSPPPPPPPSSSPRSSRPHSKPPRRQRKALGPRSLDFRPDRSSKTLCSGVENDPPLGSLPPPSTSSSPKPLSYAQVACPRGTKRSLSERICLSPVDAPSKRHASITTPTILDVRQKVLEYSTPQETSEPMEEGEDVVGGTPESGQLVRNAVQRRLFDVDTASAARAQTERLCDEHRLTKRQKQLDYGKNTIGYERYTQMVPKWKRGKNDPVTPDKFDPCSTRSWQGRIRVWRRALHSWDPVSSGPAFTDQEAALCELDMQS